MEIKVFISCEDCSKHDECDQRYAPGCYNHIGYAETIKDKEIMYTVIIYFQNGEDVTFYDITSYARFDNTMLKMTGEDGRMICFVIHNIAGFEVIPKGESNGNN